MRAMRPVGMNPNFGGITRPHSVLSIKRQVQALKRQPHCGSALIYSTEEALVVIDERLGEWNGTRAD